MEVKMKGNGSHTSFRRPFKVRFSDETIDIGRARPQDINGRHEAHKFPIVGRQDVNPDRELQNSCHGEGRLKGSLDHIHQGDIDSLALDSSRRRDGSPEPLFSGPLRDLSEEGDIGSNTVPNKVIICQYPRVKPSLPVMQRSSIFVRVDYRKDDRRKNCGHWSPRFRAGGEDFSPVSGIAMPIKKKKRESMMQRRDRHVSLVCSRGAYVNLGFRCDSKEFREQQGRMSPGKKCQLGLKKQDFVRGASHKDLIPQPLSSTVKGPSRNSLGTEMSRFDYKHNYHFARDQVIRRSQSLDFSINCLEGKRESAVSTEDGDSFESQGVSPPLSDCSLPEKLVLELSSDEEDSEDLSCDRAVTPELCQIVNLPADIVGTKVKATGVAILDGEKFLKGIVRKLNTSGFSCHKCGSMMDGRKMIKQLYESKQIS